MTTLYILRHAKATGQPAAWPSVAALADALAHSRETTAIVSHGNLIALLLGHFDPTFGYAEWAAMSTPDLFKVVLDGDSARVERII